MSEVLELLHPAVQQLWYERGFEEPTPPQIEAIPLILEGKNVLIVAPTGTGKTEAAFLPILSRMLEGERSEGVNLLYITPLRTLNRDILKRLEYWSLRLDLRLGIRHGDTSQAERRSHALIPPDIMVTTPESLQLLLMGKKLRDHLRSVRWVIVDEIHEIADSKRGSQLSILLERLKDLTGRDIQLIGLSATVGNPEEVARLLVGKDGRCEVVYTPVAKAIEVSVVWPSPRKDSLAGRLMVTEEMAARIEAIIRAVESNMTTLVFTNTRPAVEFLGSRLMLWDEEFPVYVHHGSLSQTKRVAIENMLREGKLKGVVCTSSMELGIDIGHVDFVVQFNSPREVRRLVQRVGRAGHTLEGVSRGIVLVGNSDDALESMILVDKVRREEIEPSEIPRKPYDVLAHEVMGLIMSGKWDEREIYELVTRAYPFADLSFEEFSEVLDFMEEVGLLKRIWGRLRATTRGYKYFYEALSTIPDVRQYRVIVRESGDFVGHLDDRFVAEYCEVGARFIMGGRPWEVVSLTEDTVYVEPVDDYESAIPSWVGEEIPVPYEVALEVGRVRGEVEELAAQGLSMKEVAERLAERFKVDVDTMRRAIKSIYQMVRREMPVPSHRRIVVEDAGDLVVVHAHFGNRVNRALARFLGYRLARMTGLTSYISEKPYRIIIRTEASGEDVAELLKVSREEFLRDLRVAVEDSRIFRWRLEQVARRMGVLEKEVRLTKGLVEKLLVGLRGTPVYEEALKESLERDLDVGRASEVIDLISQGNIEIALCEGPSPLSEEHVRSLKSFLEPVRPEKRDLISFIRFKMRILNEFVTFGCLDCGHVFTHPVRDLSLRCPLCGSDRLAFDLVSEEEMSARLRRCPKKRGRGCQNFRSSIHLLRDYGINAVVARASGMSFRDIKRFLEGWKGEDIFRGLYLRVGKSRG